MSIVDIANEILKNGEKAVQVEDCDPQVEEFLDDYSAKCAAHDVKKDF